MVHLNKEKKKDILKKKNVVGVGKGHKKTDYKDTGKECITVFVKSKVSKDELLDEDVIPTSIEEDETDVIEIGEVVPLTTTKASATLPQRGKHRPLIGGISTSPEEFNFAGTIGLPVVYQGDKPCLLSNTHVFAPHWENNFVGAETLIRQPAKMDGGTDDDYIAQLTEWAEIGEGDSSPHDAAIAQIANKNNIEKPEILGIGEYKYIGEPTLDLQVVKSGRTSGITIGTIIGLEVDVTVGYPHKNVVMEDQIAMSPILVGGDSGSAMVSVESPDTLIGLGFAGSKTTAFATPIKKVFDYFNLTLTPTTQEVSQEKLVNSTQKKLHKTIDLIFSILRKIKEMILLWRKK